jgi:hypothetical protein
MLIVKFGMNWAGLIALGIFIHGGLNLIRLIYNWIRSME